MRGSVCMEGGGGGCGCVCSRTVWFSATCLLCSVLQVTLQAIQGFQQLSGKRGDCMGSKQFSVSRCGAGCCLCVMVSVYGEREVEGLELWQCLHTDRLVLRSLHTLFCLHCSELSGNTASDLGFKQSRDNRHGDCMVSKRFCVCSSLSSWGLLVCDRLCMGVGEGAEAVTVCVRTVCFSGHCLPCCVLPGASTSNPGFHQL